VEFIPEIWGWFSAHKSINVIHHINTKKDQKHMIISIHAGKAANKVQHPFMIKLLNKPGVVTQSCNCSYLGEAEIRRIMVQGQPGKKVHETPISTMAGQWCTPVNPAT
jgi:hypothetical protein